MTTSLVGVDGLRTFRDALREEGSRLPRELTKTHKQVSQELAATVRGGWPVGKTGKSGASIRGTATQLAAVVRGGGPSVPWFGVEEFGGTIRRHASEKRTHYKPYRGPSKGVPWTDDNSGYYMFPVARAQREQVMGRYEQVVRELADRLFPD